MTLIRVIKRPPAPVMDGFAVGHLKPGHIYDVSDALATYLTIAGYATPTLTVTDDQRRVGKKKDEPTA